jgi:predicted site-specific integrase-resolvase
VVRAFCAKNGTELPILNQGQLPPPEQEMVQDLLTIVDCFYARLYGAESGVEELRT